MTTELIPDEIQFAENPEPRCPCVLVVDVSSSMSGAPINELNSGIATFAQELKADLLASLRTEVAIVAFNHSAWVERDFATADRFSPPKLDASGGTQIAPAVNLALDIIEKRKQMYRENGIDYYRPWLFLMTDGGDPSALEVASRLKNEDANKRVAAFSVGVGLANMELLAQMSPRRPLMLKGLEFSSMFVWLSQSMSRVSASQTDDEIALDTDGLKDWAVI